MRSMSPACCRDGAGAILDMVANRLAQFGEDFGLEPRVLPHPDRRTPRGMRQREEVRQEFAVSAHPLGHRQPARTGQVMALRIGSHEQGQPVFGQQVEDAMVPLRRAFAARGLVAAAGLAGILVCQGDTRA